MRGGPSSTARRSLATGFGYTSHDLPEDVIDEAYAKLATFFSMDQAAKRQLHPRRRKHPHRYMDQVLPEAAVPGITEVLVLFHERIYDLQRRFLWIIAVGLGAHEELFESMLPCGSTLTRAIRYPPRCPRPRAGRATSGRGSTPTST